MEIINREIRMVQNLIDNKSETGVDINNVINMFKHQYIRIELHNDIAGIGNYVCARVIGWCEINHKLNIKLDRYNFNILFNNIRRIQILEN